VEKSLDVITRNEATPRNQGPSWCPRWDNTVQTVVLNPGAPHPLLSKFTVDDIEVLTPEFQASGDLEPEARIDLYSGILICRGVLVDCITGHGKAMNWDSLLPKKHGDF
jgi:hypothetical protein